MVEKRREDGPVAFAFESIRIRCIEECSRLAVADRVVKPPAISNIQSAVFGKGIAESEKEVERNWNREEKERSRESSAIVTGP